MGLFKELSDAIDEFEEATELLDLAMQEEHEKATAYLRDFRVKIAGESDIATVRARIASEQADAQNEELLDVWREASRRCAKLASIRLQELLKEEERRRIRAAEEATLRRQREEARVARLKQEADDAERRRLQAERATQDAIRARQAERRPPPSPAPTTRPIEKVATPPRGPQPVAPPAMTPAPRVVAPTPRTPAALTTASAHAPTHVTGPSRSPLTGLDLKRWREHAKLSQRQAAERLGVAHGTVGKAEAVASAALPPALLEALARAIGT